MQSILDNSMSQIFNNDREASNACNYAYVAEIDISDSHILSPVFHNTSQHSASKHGTPDRNLRYCLEESDLRALERAENEGMI